MPNDMEINKWENSNNEICAVLMTDEFKSTETVSISTAERPTPGDPQCPGLIFACKLFLPLQEMLDYELCVLHRTSVWCTNFVIYMWFHFLYNSIFSLIEHKDSYEIAT